MKIVVTGAAGFLGRQVGESVRAAGHDVVGVDAVPADGVTVVDLRDPDATRAAFEGCHGVAHLAGYPRAGAHAPHDVFTTNTSISFSVIDAAVAVGMRVAVYASSVSAVGYPFFEQPIVPDHLPLDDATASVPQDPYGLSKLVGEQLLDGAVARTGGRLAALSLRFPALHSPRSFVEEMPATFASGKDRRLLWAWIDTRDAAAAIAAGFTRVTSGHARHFLAAPETFSPRPTMELVAEHFPDVTLTRPLGGHDALLDSSSANALLGVAAQYSWRDYAGAAQVLDAAVPTAGSSR